MVPQRAARDALAGNGADGRNPNRRGRERSRCRRSRDPHPSEVPVKPTAALEWAERAKARALSEIWGWDRSPLPQASLRAGTTRSTQSRRIQVRAPDDLTPDTARFERARCRSYAEMRSSERLKIHVRSGVGTLAAASLLR
jgi:hypothetical protein